MSSWWLLEEVPGVEGRDSWWLQDHKYRAHSYPVNHNRVHDFEVWKICWQVPTPSLILDRCRFISFSQQWTCTFSWELIVLLTLHESALKTVLCQLIGDRSLLPPTVDTWYYPRSSSAKATSSRALSPHSSFFQHFFTLTIQLWRKWVAKTGQNPACKPGWKPGANQG